MPDNSTIAVLGGLPVSQYENCLDALDAAQGSVREAEREADLTTPAACFRYRAAPLSLEIRNPAGGVRRLTALPRMIHTRGLAVLHTGFVFPQSPAEVQLPTLDGRTLKVKASVDACRHVVGIVHETILVSVPDLDLRRLIRVPSAASTAAH